MANFVDSASRYRRSIGQLLSAYEDLIGINEEYVALDVGNNLTDDGGDVNLSDFPDITRAQFVAGVAAAQAVIATIAANDTNLYTASDGSQR